MRSFILLMVVLGGWAADADEPPPRSAPHVEGVTLLDAHEDSEMDVCALASELPFDDICSLLCDPQEMAARMVDDGNERGQCYQLYCSLPGDAHVLVGVCLPP